MQLYDFDGMFDEKLSDYIAKNKGKYSESEWEDLIPVLYRKFGDTVIKSLGKSPRALYGEMSGEELVKCLRAHLKQGVPVSGFLCGVIEERNISDKLFPLLDGTAAEKEYAVNLIGADNRAIKKYMEMLVRCDDADLKEKCAEYIKEKADIVIPEALENYKNGVEREYMLEILSRSVVPQEEIFNILIKEFRTDSENMQVRAAQLAAYGDERALPYLFERIDEDDISYLDFRELKFAIEALGGEYTAERDFSEDAGYLLLKSHEVRNQPLADTNGKKQN